MDASPNRKAGKFVSTLLALIVALSLSFPVTALADGGSSNANLKGVTALDVSADEQSQAEVDTQASKKAASISGAKVSVRAHVQNMGWQKAVSDRKTAGTTGKGLRVEGLRMTVSGSSLSGGIRYQTHVQGIGWQKPVTNGKIAGTSGKGLRVEALKVWLTGNMAKHYDVYYRAHVQGIGWQLWRKSGEMAGTTGQGRRVEAIQVFLSPKTEVAAGKKASTIGVRYNGRVQGTGWQKWMGDGETSGSTGKAKMIQGIQVRLSTGKSSGSIKYQAYMQNSGWQKWTSNGALAGSKTNKRVEALRMKLTGSIQKTHNVFYRVHIREAGWLGWAKNGASAGSKGLSLPIEAYQVVVKKKGLAAPSNKGCNIEDAFITEFDTDNELDGIDISSWQEGIDVKQVDADFVIVKATEGTDYTNPYYKEFADDALSSGKLLGLYHFAVEGDAIDQADYFVKKVKSYVGKALLFLDWEDTSYSETMAQGTGWAKKWLDRVYQKTGVKPLIYMSKNRTREYNWTSVARKYGLWVAQYPDYEETGYQDDPWTDDEGYGAWDSPTIFQYTSSGVIDGWDDHLDLNKFYGSKSDWKEMASKK